MMRHIRGAARKVLAASDEQIKILAQHDPDCFRDIAASLLCARGQAHRFGYIVQQAHTHGRVNRSDIQREFGVSAVQASKDLQVVLSGGSIRYDKSVKSYVPQTGERP